MRIQIVVEQPGNEPYRMKYIPGENRFIRTESMSLGYARGFRGAYGWVKGHGQPPQPHRDVFLICEGDYAPGTVLDGKIVGCFCAATVIISWSAYRQNGRRRTWHSCPTVS